MMHKMSTWWGIVILLGSEILHTCSDKPKIVCAPVGGLVSVPCPKSSADTVKFRLSKDGDEIHHHKRQHGKNTSNMPSSNTAPNTVGVEYKEAEDSSFSFTLARVNASSTGIYRCEGTVMFPPPLIQLPSTAGILLLVEGHPCDNCTNKNVEVAPTRSSVWWWIFTLMVSSYSVAVSIGAIIIWVKWRKEDSQSAYVNTNPKTTRKNRGRLHNPTPRFFYAQDR